MQLFDTWVHGDNTIAERWSQYTSSARSTRSSTIMVPNYIGMDRNNGHVMWWTTRNCRPSYPRVRNTVNDVLSNANGVFHWSDYWIAGLLNLFNYSSLAATYVHYDNTCKFRTRSWPAVRPADIILSWTKTLFVLEFTMFACWNDITLNISIYYI